MFRCPTSGERLVKARAGGSTIWYSPATDGRLLSLSVARHFFGEHRTREVWMGSAAVASDPDMPCPSCGQGLRPMYPPAWVGSAPFWVCRVCRLFWIEGSDYPEVPRGSELPNPRGDSTLVKDLGEAYLDHKKLQHAAETGAASGPIPQPDSFGESFVSFLGLPVERSGRHVPEWTVISAVILTAMLLLQIFFTDPVSIAEYGFYPDSPFKNGGLNVFFSVFLHRGWLHLIFNFYFAWILTDDVEDDLGWKKFLAFLVFGIGVSAVLQTLLSRQGDVPHIGYSGVVMALFAYYGFQFPKAKMIWVLPRVHIWNSGTFQTALRGWGWFQIRALWVALFYLAGDIGLYFLLEREGHGRIAHSAHIAGFVAGYVFWKLFAVKTFHRDEKDVFESHLDRLLPNTESDRRRLPP